MSKRPTIGDDPLAAFVGAPSPRRSTPAARSTSKAKPTRQPSPPRTARKVHATFVLPGELVDEARNAVVTLAGPPVRLTLAQLVEQGIRHELDRLKKAHHQNKPWPTRAANLTGGRPIGS